MLNKELSRQRLSRKIRCNFNSAVLNSKLCSAGYCGWELGKDFLQVAPQEQEAESKDRIPLLPKSPKSRHRAVSQPGVCWVEPGGLLSPLSFRRSRLWGKSVLQESAWRGAGSGETSSLYSP